MEIRGERECQSCGSRWSYYETGSVTCPDCGSPLSVGVGERAEHTDDPATFDLTPLRAAVDEMALDDLAAAAAEEARDYCRRAGFVHGGELQPLSDTYLAAAELAAVGAALDRRLRPTEETELYFLRLLEGADRGDRPAPGEVPRDLRGARGRACARAVEDYQADLHRLLDDGATDPPVRRVRSSIRTRRKRIDALDGDVEPAEAERIVRAARDLGEYLREDDEAALARAESRFEN